MKAGSYPTRGRSIWRVFAHRVFFALWIAALVSNIGTWMQNVGDGWLMTSLSPSPLMVALIQTSSSLPILLLALPAGAMADIVDRRRLLIVIASLDAGGSGGARCLDDREPDDAVGVAGAELRARRSAQP